MFTTVPFIIVLLFGYDSVDQYLFRFVIMLDTTRVYLTLRVINDNTYENTREILNIGNIMLLIIFFPAAFCSFIESADSYPEYPRENATYFEMVYFIFISMTFIGYGSQVETDAGKTFMTFFLLTAFIVLPAQAGKLMNLFAAKSPWARAKFEKISNEIPHLIIMGQVSNTNLKNFLDEFYHDDHGD